MKELKLNIFERKISRRIYYGPCINTRTGIWRKSHNEELNELFQRPNIIKEMSKNRMNWGDMLGGTKGHYSLVKRKNSVITTLLYGCL